MIRYSIIIPTRNRAVQLARTLDTILAQDIAARDTELVLADSASTDETPAVMRAFAERSSPLPVRIVRAERPGASLARNVGIRAARGDVFVFIDDDCELAPDYLPRLRAGFDPASHDYGAGAMLQADPALDIRVANTEYWRFKGPTAIPPRSVLQPGSVHGGNMFVRRAVVERIGMFREDLGEAGLRGEDLEFGVRASLAGCPGILLPDVRIFHAHGCAAGSPEADAVAERYARNRGAYYAMLIVAGRKNAWDLWRAGPISATNLRTEFEAAAHYLRHCHPARIPRLAAADPD